MELRDGTLCHTDNKAVNQVCLGHVSTTQKPIWEVSHWLKMWHSEPPMHGTTVCHDTWKNSLITFGRCPVTNSLFWKLVNSKKESSIYFVFLVKLYLGSPNSWQRDVSLYESIWANNQERNDKNENFTMLHWPMKWRIQAKITGHWDPKKSDIQTHRASKQKYLGVALGRWYGQVPTSFGPD